MYLTWIFVHKRGVPGGGGVPPWEPGGGPKMVKKWHFWLPGPVWPNCVQKTMVLCHFFHVSYMDFCAKCNKIHVRYMEKVTKIHGFLYQKSASPGFLSNSLDFHRKNAKKLQNRPFWLENPCIFVQKSVYEAWISGDTWVFGPKSGPPGRGGVPPRAGPGRAGRDPLEPAWGSPTGGFQGDPGRAGPGRAGPARAGPAWPAWKSPQDLPWRGIPAGPGRAGPDLAGPGRAWPPWKPAWGCPKAGSGRAGPGRAQASRAWPGSKPGSAGPCPIGFGPVQTRFVKNHFFVGTEMEKVASRLALWIRFNRGIQKLSDVNRNWSKK